MNSKKSKTLYIAVYTLVFVVMAAAVWSLFFVNGKSLICHADAWRQHIRATMYTAKYYRGVLYRLLHGSFPIFENYSFGMGYGADLVTTLQYYAVGDLLTLPAMFVPTQYMNIYFQIEEVLRFYLAGLGFSAYAIYRTDVIERTKINYVALLASAMTYALCGYALYLGIWHPFFAQGMVFLPLMLLGVDRCLHEHKPGFFMLATFLGLLGNFYFFYMCAALTVLYILVCLISRELTDKHKLSIPTLFKSFMQVFGYMLVGIVSASILFLPVVMAVMNNPRSDSGITVSMFYEPDFYQELFANFISFVYHPRTDGSLGYTAFALIAVFVMFIRFGKNKIKGTLLIILTTMMMLPIAGYIMAAFSYAINRWVFAMAMLVSFILYQTWDDLLSLSKREIGILCGCAGIYIALTIICGQLKNPGTGVSLILLVVGIVLLIIAQKVNGKQVISLVMCGMVMLSIWCNAYFAYAPEQGNMIDEYVDNLSAEGFIQELDSNEVMGIRQIRGDQEEAFYRYTGRNLVWNASLMTGVSSTQFLWSLADGNVSDYFKTIANNDQQNFAYFALDDRAILNTLASVKYYSLRFNDETNRSFVPYGFEQVSEFYNFAFFQNKNQLPLGYAYQGFISKSDFMKLAPYQRQEAMLFGIVVDDEQAKTLSDEGFNRAGIDISSQVIAADITCDKGTTFDGKSVTTTEEGSGITLEFDGMTEAETYLYLGNLWYRGSASDSDVTLGISSYAGDTQVNYKDLLYRTEDSQYYSGWHDFVINTGYGADAKTKIYLQFSHPGTYTFDQLEVVCQPLENLDSQTMVLQQSTLQNVDLHRNPISFATSKVTGTVHADTDELMLLTLPYSRGWSARIDGQKVDISKGNVMFSWINVPAGDHEIELVYATPGFHTGMVLSILGLACMCVLTIRADRKAKKANTSKNI